MKPLHAHDRRKSNHALARLRDIIGEKQIATKDALGIPLDTVKSIQSGRLKFTERVALKVSRWTGADAGCLLENNPAKPLLTVDGKPYTRDFFFRHAMTRDEAPDRNKEAMPSRCLHWYRILSIKIARVLLAAQLQQDADFAFFKLRREICRVGEQFKEFGSEKDLPNVIGTDGQQVGDGIGNKDSLQCWDYDLQGVINRMDIKPRKGEPKPKPVKLTTKQQKALAIWNNFERALTAIRDDQSRNPAIPPRPAKARPRAP